MIVAATIFFILLRKLSATSRQLSAFGFVLLDHQGDFHPLADLPPSRGKGLGVLPPVKEEGICFLSSASLHGHLRGNRNGVGRFCPIGRAADPTACTTGRCLVSPGVVPYAKYRCRSARCAGPEGLPPLRAYLLQARFFFVPGLCSAAAPAYGGWSGNAETRTFRLAEPLVSSSVKRADPRFPEGLPWVFIIPRYPCQAGGKPLTYHNLHDFPSPPFRRPDHTGAATLPSVVGPRCNRGGLAVCAKG